MDKELNKRQSTVLIVSVFVIAICGLIYELIVGTLSSYLFGNSVTQFSLTIGLFMTSMGIGSYASRWINRTPLTWFILLEVAIAAIGGVSAALLYIVFAVSDFYHLVMVLLILIIGGLIGLEIPLLTRIIGGRDALKDTLANVLAFDYLGALIASLLFPLLLLPYLGLLKTSFATGLLNLLVAGANAWTFRTHLKKRRSLTRVVGVVALGLLAGLVWSPWLTTFFERHMYDDTVIYTEQTPYQRIVITRWGKDIRLYLDGGLQFSSMDEYRYHEALVHPAMSLTQSRENVLVLGGGDGPVARELLKYDDVRTITVVDIDPQMTQLARTHPAILAINEGALNDPRVNLVHEDAYRYLEETAELFGVIIIDLPDPNNEGLGKLYSREFYKLVQRHLAQGGMVVTQATSPYFARESFWCIAHTLADTGLVTLPYHVYIPSFGDWGFVLAAHQPIQPERFTLGVSVRFFSSEVFAASQVFDGDVAELETEVNNLDSQVVLRYYEKGWKRWQ